MLKVTTLTFPCFSANCYLVTDETTKESLIIDPGSYGERQKDFIKAQGECDYDNDVMEEIEKHGLKLFGVLPHDEEIYRCDCAGEPSAKLPASNSVKQALSQVLQSIGL